MKDVISWMFQHFTIVLDIIVVLTMFLLMWSMIALSSFQKTCSETFQRYGGTTPAALEKVNSDSKLFKVTAKNTNTVEFGGKISYDIDTKTDVGVLHCQTFSNVRRN